MQRSIVSNTLVVGLWALQVACAGGPGSDTPFDFCDDLDENVVDVGPDEQTEAGLTPNQLVALMFPGETATVVWESDNLGADALGPTAVVDLFEPISATSFSRVDTGETDRWVGSCMTGGLVRVVTMAGFCFPDSGIAASLCHRQQAVILANNQGMVEFSPERRVPLPVGDLTPGFELFVSAVAADTGTVQFDWAGNAATVNFLLKDFDSAARIVEGDLNAN